jgi:hypothetical protein
MSGIKEKYNQLKKKYSLPSYDDLNQEFNLEDINAESELVLQNVRRKIYEKIDYYAELIESVLQPESSLANMYEAHYTEDDEKNKAYSIFKRLLYILRYSKLVALDNNEEENAKFINEVHSEWNSTKKDIKYLIKRLLEIWKIESDIKEDLSYMG